MSLDDFEDEVFLGWLDTGINFFKSPRIDMKLSAKIIEDIVTQVKQKPNLDHGKIKKLFTDLQDTIDVEFSKKGEYEKKIIEKLHNQIKTALKNHNTEVQNAFQTSKRYERTKQRYVSSHNVETLRYLVTREPREDVEKRFIGLSYAYSNLISGVFRFSIQDCYTWEKISNGEQVDPDVIADMDVAEIYNYFKQKKDLLYFEGFDLVVRHAVAHSNFEFDSSTEEITYVNETRNVTSSTGTTGTNRQTSTYSYEQMVENYEKLEKIYELVMVTTQELMVSTCLAKLTERYP